MIVWYLMPVFFKCIFIMQIKIVFLKHWFPAEPEQSHWEIQKKQKKPLGYSLKYDARSLRIKPTAIEGLKACLV